MDTVKSPARKKRDRQRKKREESKWSAKSGPVQIRIATSEELAKYRKK
jgi:hypothetical protein